MVPVYCVDTGMSTSNCEKDQVVNLTIELESKYFWIQTALVLFSSKHLYKILVKQLILPIF